MKRAVENDIQQLVNIVGKDNRDVQRLLSRLDARKIAEHEHAYEYVIDLPATLRKTG